MSLRLCLHMDVADALKASLLLDEGDVLAMVGAQMRRYCPASSHKMVALGSWDLP